MPSLNLPVTTTQPLNNLQPLWAADNMSKGAKWDGIINA